MQVLCNLIAWLKAGAISLLGKVGVFDPPFTVLPLTVEPTKPRLCHDSCYLNLWIRDLPFSLERLVDLPHYVSKDTYQTVLDDKSGYDLIILSEDGRTYFEVQWGGWYFTYNTHPFGWKISPFVYHTTRLLASNFFYLFILFSQTITVSLTLHNKTSHYTPTYTIYIL